jgi:hypothetical protein
MIVSFHENVLLLSTYKFIFIPIKYRNFGACVYDSAEEQMLTAISLVTKQRKNEFDRIGNVRFSPSVCMPWVVEITFRTPARIYF